MKSVRQMNDMEVMQARPDLRALGMSVQLIRKIMTHEENEQHDGRMTQCPQCGALHRYEGRILNYCDCGYCRHASRDHISDHGDTRCNHCGLINPTMFEMTEAHQVILPAPAAVAKGQ